MNKPHSVNEYHNVQSMDSVCWPASSQIPPLSTPVTELCRICSLIGMPQPDFSFLRTPQTMTVCQVKLSNGLLVHGPQCHSENEAKEKAALFALQQLGSLVNFPLSPPIFPNYPSAVTPGTIPPVFPQPTANIMPPSHLFGSMPWGPPVPVPGKPFHHPPYSGTMPMAGVMPGGVHNQFIPLQVTKKRVANKKIIENKEAQSSSQTTPAKTNQPGSSEVPKGSLQECPSASLKPSESAPPSSSVQVETASQGHGASHHKSAPSSSRRKSRKLAVNFGISKPSE